MKSIHNINELKRNLNEKQSNDENVLIKELLLKIFEFSNVENKKKILLLNLKILFYIINSKEFKFNLINKIQNHFNFNKFFK